MKKKLEMEEKERLEFLDTLTDIQLQVTGL